MNPFHFFSNKTLHLIRYSKKYASRKSTWPATGVAWGTEVRENIKNSNLWDWKVKSFLSSNCISFLFCITKYRKLGDLDDLEQQRFIVSQFSNQSVSRATISLKSVGKYHPLPLPVSHTTPLNCESVTAVSAGVLSTCSRSLFSEYVCICVKCHLFTYLFVYF